MRTNDTGRVVQSLIAMGDDTFQEALHHAMLRGLVPYIDYKSVRIRERSGRADFKGYKQRIQNDPTY